MEGKTIEIVDERNGIAWPIHTHKIKNEYVGSTEH